MHNPHHQTGLREHNSCHIYARELLECSSCGTNHKLDFMQLMVAGSLPYTTLESTLYRYTRHMALTRQA